MTVSQGFNSDEFEGILADYLAACENGDPPELDELAAAHPRYAKELIQFVADKHQIDGIVESPQDKTPADVQAPTLAQTPAAAQHAIPPPQPGVGETVRYFGDYELLEEIARGGMGVVYKARQINLNRTVALKMILAGQLASEQEVRRFYTEAEAAAGLDHPGIVPIHEVGQHEGQHYYCMGFVQGDSLAELLSDGPLPPKRAAELLREVADAVAYAHDHGVIHRDLKPSNILLAGKSCVRDSDQGSWSEVQDRKPSQGRGTPSDLQADQLQPKVTDFGLAKKIEGDSSLTGTGQILGTPSYMSPEQIKGDPDKIGPTTDVYALGAILYCSLTGRPPFQAATAMETIMQALDKEAISPKELNPVVPRDLETICLKCLEKDPKARYASTNDLRLELQRYLQGHAIAARPLSKFARVVRWARRSPVQAALVTVSACSVLLILGVALGFNMTLRAERDYARSQETLAKSSAFAAQVSETRAKDRLWDSLVQQALADRSIGRRSEALEAIRQASMLKKTSTLTTEAIETIFTPGLKLQTEIEFGHARLVEFVDEHLIAVHGIFDPLLDKSGDRDWHKAHAQVVIFDALSGRRVSQPIEVPLAATRSNVAAPKRFFKIPDRSILVYAASLKNPTEIVVVNYVTGERLATFIGHWTSRESAQAFLRVNSSGTKIAVPHLDPGSRREFLTKIWDIQKGHFTDQTFSGVPSRFLSENQLQLLFAGNQETVDLETSRVISSHARKKAMRGSSQTGLFVGLDHGVYDHVTGDKLFELTGNRSEISADRIRLSPVGSAVAWPSDRTHRFRIWSKKDGLVQEYKGKLRGDDNWGFEVASFSPDGRRFLSLGSLNQTSTWRGKSSVIQIHDVVTGRQLCGLENETAPTWNPTAQLIATVGEATPRRGDPHVRPNEDRTFVRIWRLEQSMLEAAAEPDVQRITLSSDSNTISTGADLLNREDELTLAEQAELADYRKHFFFDEQGRRCELDLPSSLEPVSPTSLQIDGIGKLEIDLPQPEDYLEGSTHPQHVGYSVSLANAKCLSVDAESKMMVAALAIWSRWDTGSAIGGHTTILAAWKLDGTSSKPMWAIQTGGIKCLDVDWVRGRIATGFGAGTAVRDLRSGQRTHWFEHRLTWVSKEELSPFYYNSRSGTLQEGFEYSQFEAVNDLRFQADSGVLFSACNTGTIYGLDLDKDDVVYRLNQPKSFTGNEMAATSLDTDSSGQRVAVGFATGQMHIWQSANGLALWNWQAHEGEVTATTFDSTRGELVTGSREGEVRIWKLEAVAQELSALGL